MNCRKPLEITVFLLKEKTFLVFSNNLTNLKSIASNDSPLSEAKPQTFCRNVANLQRGIRFFDVSRYRKSCITRVKEKACDWAIVLVRRLRDGQKETSKNAPKENLCMRMPQNFFLDYLVVRVYLEILEAAAKFKTPGI